jgi:hypothetical protein
LFDNYREHRGSKHAWQTVSGGTASVPQLSQWSTCSNPYSCFTSSDFKPAVLVAPSDLLEDVALDRRALIEERGGIDASSAPNNVE